MRHRTKTYWVRGEHVIDAHLLTWRASVDCIQTLYCVCVTFVNMFHLKKISFSSSVVIETGRQNNLFGSEAKIIYSVLKCERSLIDSHRCCANAASATFIFILGCIRTMVLCVSYESWHVLSFFVLIKCSDFFFASDFSRSDEFYAGTKCYVGFNSDSPSIDLCVFSSIAVE